MLIFLLWIYIVFLTILWTFFIISKISVDNFLFLNKNIKKVNRFFFAILLFLTILWFVMIFFTDFNKTISVDYSKDINWILHY